MNRLSSLCKLDIFTKIDSSFTRTSSTGGTVSLVTYVIIGILLFAEFTTYLNSNIIFKYSIDTDIDKKLDINVDMTIATPCANIGADIMDSTNKHSLYTYGQLKEKNTFFKLKPNQQSEWNVLKELNNFIREEHHNIHQLIWKSYNTVDSNERPLLVHEEREPAHQSDSCRLHGTLSVNKVSGNFHISAGKYLPLPIGHAHISLIGNDRAVNFSHRIEKLSFGEEIPNVINTLDGVEKITHSSKHLYQYYLKLVLTNVKTSAHQAEIYQYSVTERDFAVDHDSGAHGVPGIYFKYEIDGLKVNVGEDTIPLWKFLVRLCAIVGGILAISGFLNHIATYVVDIITCKYVGDINIQ